MARPLTVRFRVDLGERCSVGIGKIELLEGIERSGSLSQAARDMKMSYRRAWLLLQDLNVNFDQPVALASTGGRGGGGVTLTAFGRRLMAGYRQLERALQSLAETHLNSFSRHAKGPGSAQNKSVASIRRRPSAQARRPHAARPA
jgi:molybdate transport system regulatory protein